MTLTFKKAKYFYFIFLIVTCLLIVFQAVSFYRKVKRDEKRGVLLAEKEMSNAQSSFGERLEQLTVITNRLANSITQGEMDSLEVMQELEKVMKANEDVFGFGVGYEPNEFSSSRRLFGPFFIRPNNELKLEFIEDSYDYSEKDWYTRPLKNGAAWFEPPYFGAVAQTMMAEYSVPFYKTDENGVKVPIGIVFLDYSLEDITKAVQSLDLGKSGYGFMFSEEGIMVAHPVAENIQSKKTIDEFATDWKSEGVRNLFDSLTVGGKDYIEIINPVNGVECRMFFKEIKGSGWRLGAVFADDAFKTDSDYVNKVVITFIGYVVMLTLLLVAYFIHKNNASNQIIFKSIPVMAGVFLVAIAGIWFSKMYQPYNLFQQKNSHPVSEVIGLQKFLADQDSLRKYYHEPEIIKIPTGVFLKHIEFDGSHNIRLSGMVWQRFDKHLDSLKITPGVFFMSTAPDAEVLDLTQVYSKKIKGETVVGWYFRVEVREPMHYGLYPLDRERISLQIEHPDLSENIQLVPDFDSYASIISTELPGIDKDIILPEWDTEESYFDFQKHTYNTNFGVLSLVDNDYKCDLGFNIVLKRKFFWPFMANVIPLSTISVLLFLALVSISKNRTFKKGILFSGFGLLELCAAFLFVAILTHIDLRSNMVVNYIIYMDYFYFHIYFTIIICSITAVLYNKEENRRHMKIVRYFYWPTLLGSLFLFSMVIFY